MARVDFAVGNVTAQGADGRTRALRRGSEIEVGDTVNTQQGRAQLRFQDGAYMSLQPETAFKVEQFRFTENGGGSDNVVMNLLKGGMRTITGLIGRANRQNYKFRTEVATIGIRGTEYAVRYTNSIEVFCAGGAIDIVNEGGTLILGTGQGGFVQSPTQEPKRTDERPFLPPTAASGTQEAQEQIAPPVNPVQESQTAALLTGKFTGNGAFSHRFFNEASIDRQVELDADGILIALDSTEGPLSIGGAVAEPLSESLTPTQRRAGNDGIIAWGRWISGVPNGQIFSGDLATQGAFHYVVGLPATNMPTTGVATYDMIGATTPTFTSGISSASVNSSSIEVDFLQGTPKFHLNMTVDGQAFDTGAGVGLSRSGAHLQGSQLQGCSTFLNVQGFLAGPGATRAGMAYLLDISSETVNGAIAYQRGALAPSP
ncbi:MAG: FecR family protein [Burkholderiales bacterium]